MEAHLLYVAYEGWIYSGRQQWSVDKLTLTDSEGQVSSFCKENGQLLPSGLPVKLTLTEGECVTASPAALAAALAAAAAAAAVAGGDFGPNHYHKVLSFELWVLQKCTYIYEKAFLFTFTITTKYL